MPTIPAFGLPCEIGDEFVRRVYSARDWRVCGWVRECQGDRAEEQAFVFPHVSVLMQIISENGVTRLAQVATDLMISPGFWHDLKLGEPIGVE